MPNAQKITSVYRTTFLQNHLKDSRQDHISKYDSESELNQNNQRNAKETKFFKDVLKEQIEKRRKSGH